MKKLDKNTYKGYASMWFIFGCSSMASILLFNADLLFRILGSFASLSFFSASWISFINISNGFQFIEALIFIHFQEFIVRGCC